MFVFVAVLSATLALNLHYFTIKIFGRRSFTSSIGGTNETTGIFVRAVIWSEIYRKISSSSRVDSVRAY